MEPKEAKAEINHKAKNNNIPIATSSPSAGTPAPDFALKSRPDHTISQRVSQ